MKKEFLFCAQCGNSTAKVPILKYVNKEKEIVDLTKWTITSFMSIFFFLLSMIILLLSIPSTFFVHGPPTIIDSSLLVGGEYYIAIVITQILAFILAIYSFFIGLAKPKQDIYSLALSGIYIIIMFLIPIFLVGLGYLNLWFGYYV